VAIETSKGISVVENKGMWCERPNSVRYGTEDGGRKGMKKMPFSAVDAVKILAY